MTQEEFMLRSKIDELEAVIKEKQSVIDLLLQSLNEMGAKIDIRVQQINDEKSFGSKLYTKYCICFEPIVFASVVPMKTLSDKINEKIGMALK